MNVPMTRREASRTIAVLTASEAEGPVAADVSCRLGRDVKAEPRWLADFCGRDLGPRLDDLVVLAAAVEASDRVVERPATGWRRDLHLCVPVRDLDFWASASVGGELSGLLDFLTGDGWAFEFRHRRDPPQVGRQGALPLPPGDVAVLPFSDGLDSLATAHLAPAREGGLRLVLLTVGPHVGRAGWRERGLGGTHHRARFPYSPPRGTDGAPRAREDSGRARTFLYYTLAAVAAGLLGTPRVVVPEAGQGALGSWLAQEGSETPDLRCNPLFTRRLARWLAVVFETTPAASDAVRFEHPHLWRTKGQVLADLRESGRAAGWIVTRSCARHPRHMLHLLAPGRERVGCGFCSQCVLRQQSVLAAGLDAAPAWRERYVRREVPFERPAGDAMNDNDRSYAAAGAGMAARLARLADGPPGPAIRAVAALAAETERPSEEVARNMRALLSAHRAEVAALAATQGPGSLLRVCLGLAA